LNPFDVRHFDFLRHWRKDLLNLPRVNVIIDRVAEESFLQEDKSFGRELDLLACFFIETELVFKEMGVKLELVSIIEVPEDCPANLYFEQFYPSFLEGNKTFKCDAIVIGVILEFLSDHFFDPLDVALVKVSLEDLLLEMEQVLIAPFIIVVSIANAEDPGESFLEFFSKRLFVQVIELSEREETGPLSAVDHVCDAFSLMH
jgi:hypothetical protein